MPIVTLADFKARVPGLGYLEGDASDLHCAWTRLLADDSLAAEWEEHINDVTMRNLVYVPMEQGDVVLVDNYQVMHGRDVFTGERLHAVTWFQ